MEHQTTTSKEATNSPARIQLEILERPNNQIIVIQCKDTKDFDQVIQHMDEMRHKGKGITHVTSDPLFRISFGINYEENGRFSETFPPSLFNITDHRKKPTAVVESTLESTSETITDTAKPNRNIPSSKVVEITQIKGMPSQENSIHMTKR